MAFIDSDKLIETLNERRFESCGYEHSTITSVIELVNDMVTEVKIAEHKEGLNTRKEFLTGAMTIVCNDREQQYGSPEDNFGNIASLWSAYMGADVSAKDVSIMMALMKIARIKSGRFKADSWVDGIGYLACGAEIASREKE